MSEEQLSLRIRVIAATKNGLDKTLSALRGFASKVKSVAAKASSSLSGFGSSIPRINTAPALSALTSFASMSRSIMGRAFSGILGLASKFARSFARSIARGIKWATVAFVGFLGWSLKTSSWAEEMESKFDIVFGKMAKSSRKWAEDFAKSTGDSKYEIMSFMSSMQDLFVPMGFTRKAAADLSKQFTQLGIDLASFNNIKPEEAMEKLQSALTGMYRPLRDMGVLLTDEKVKLKAVEMGLAKNTKHVSDMAMTYARLKLIEEQSTDARNDAIRTSGSFANRMKAVRSAFKDLRVEIGKQLTEGGSFRSLLGDIGEKIKGLIKWLKDTGAVEKWGKKLKEWLTKAYAAVKPIADEIAKLFSEDKGVREQAQKDLAQKFSDLGTKLGEAFMEKVFPALESAATVMAKIIGTAVSDALKGWFQKRKDEVKEKGVIATAKEHWAETSAAITILTFVTGLLKKFGGTLKDILGFGTKAGKAAAGKKVEEELLTKGFSKSLAQKLAKGGHIRDVETGAKVSRFGGLGGLLRVLNNYLNKGLTAIFGKFGASIAGLTLKIVGFAYDLFKISQLLYFIRQNAVSAKVLNKSQADLQEQESKYGYVEAARRKRLAQNNPFPGIEKYESIEGFSKLSQEIRKLAQRKEGSAADVEKINTLMTFAEELARRQLADESNKVIELTPLTNLFTDFNRLMSESNWSKVSTQLQNNNAGIEEKLDETNSLLGEVRDSLNAE